MNEGIRLNNVYKRYGDQMVLDGVNQEFLPGLIHGITGRNGSGKTVLLKCICGFTPVTKGEIFVFSKPVRCFVPQNIGIILEEPGFLGSYSAYTNLRILAGIRRKPEKQALCAALEKVGLDPTDKKPVEKFSLGMRHRLAIAQAIIDKPPLLILDEPMNGLDRDGVKEISELFSRLRQEGITILITSHYPEDLARISDSIWHMESGKLSLV